MRSPFCFRTSTLLGLVCLFCACALCGCAGKKPATDPEAAMCAAGTACAPEEKLDSLRAKMAMTLVDVSGKEQNLDAVR